MVAGTRGDSVFRYRSSGGRLGTASVSGRSLGQEEGMAFPAKVLGDSPSFRTFKVSGRSHSMVVQGRPNIRDLCPDRAVPDPRVLPVRDLMVYGLHATMKHCVPAGHAYGRDHRPLRVRGGVLVQYPVSESKAA